MLVSRDPNRTIVNILPAQVIIMIEVMSAADLSVVYVHRL